MRRDNLAVAITTKGRNIIGILLVAAMPILSACGTIGLASEPAKGSAPAASRTELTEEVLKNTTYELPDLGVVELQGGQFEFKYGEGATQVNKAGYQMAGFGDLDGDGIKDAAVILWSNTGGTGTFIHLIAVRNQNGAPQQLAVTRIGDRERISAVSVKDGRIAVDMTTFGPNDPKCCPSQQATKTYQLSGASLKPVQ